MPDYYQILAVDRHATTLAVARAFRAAMAAVSKTGAPASDIRQLLVAYGVLSNPASRAAYDRGMRQLAGA